MSRVSRPGRRLLATTSRWCGDSLPHDELCFCDLTTSPDGELVTVDWRIAEIRERYGPGHVVTQFIDLAEDELVATVRRVEAIIDVQPK